MKSRGAIFFLFVAGLCLLGSLPLHGLQTRWARHLMKERMEALLDVSDLEVLQFDFVDGKVADPDFQLRPDGKEFTYQGHHYDIFKYQEAHGKVIFWVLQDEVEDHLLAQLQGQGSSENPMQTASKTILKLLGLGLPNSPVRVVPSPQQFAGIAPEHHGLWSDCLMDIVSPPPQA